jgi:hypothetical protein
MAFGKYCNSQHRSQYCETTFTHYFPAESYFYASFPALAELQPPQHVTDDFFWRLTDAKEQRAAWLF